MSMKLSGCKQLYFRSSNATTRPTKVRVSTAVSNSVITSAE